MIRSTPAVRANDSWQLFLLALRYREGHLVTVGGNEPFLLRGDTAWIVYSGTVDLFVVALEDGEPTGRHEHFARLTADQLMMGLELDDSDVGLLAVCGPDTQLLRLAASRLKRFGQDLEYAEMIAALVDDWTRTLALGIAPEVSPKDVRSLAAGDEIEVVEGDVLGSASGVVWVRGMDDACALAAGDSQPCVSNTQFFPLSDSLWLRATAASRLEARATAAYLAEDQTWDALGAFARFALRVASDQRRAGRDASQRLIEERLAADEQRLQAAVLTLSETWGDGAAAAVVAPHGSAPLSVWLAACQMVGAWLGVEMKLPVEDTTPGDPIAAITRASYVRVRRVTLYPGWWEADNGPLLGLLNASHQPVALLPAGPGRYQLHDPAAGVVRPVDDTVTSELDTDAFMFYRPLPNRPLRVVDLLRYGARPLRRDFGWLVAAGVAGGVVGTLIPIMTGLIFDRIIPAGDASQLALVGLILLLSVAGVTLFQIIRSQALLRIELWMGSTIQAAIWDRLLKLPVSFFRGYSPGDLAERAMSINVIRLLLSDSVVLALLSGIFSVFNFLILFVIDAQLALVVTLLAALLVGLTIAVGGRMVVDERASVIVQGEVAGLVTQLFSGISKLHVTGAERRAFALWANRFGEQKRLMFRARSDQILFLVVMSAFPVLVSIVVFTVMTRRADLSTGAFLAFNSALVLFLTATVQLCGAVIAALRVVPVYEQLKPILNAVPEVDVQKASPGILKGAIEASHVTFRYSPDGPVVLDDINFSVRPGEFVALVGPSGSGKSTLMRLLLGFEAPESGSIYYDGLALTDLDLREVRRQIGVVLQHSQVSAGSIFTNIVGSDLLTLEDAWEAARLAGIADDIEQMPMGMQTFISEGGTTFSGGQRQRLLIARALAGKPRMFFLDEATSALDDLSQAVVTESLKQIKATRLVIAHRLSTIMDADRIIVLDKGRIVETGTYKDLMVKGGTFARLARRQLA